MLHIFLGICICFFNVHWCNLLVVSIKATHNNVHYSLDECLRSLGIAFGKNASYCKL